MRYAVTKSHNEAYAIGRASDCRLWVRRRYHLMLSLKIYNKIITWPEDVAVFMMKFYENHGILFEVQENEIQSDE